MRHSLSKVFFAVFMLAATVSVGYCFEDGSYTTPDNWSQQVTAGRIVQSTTGVGLTADTSLYTTLTTRLRLKSNEYADDSDVFQYIRMHTDAAQVGNGTVKFSIYGRLADDINGDSESDWSDSYYYVHRDILDADMNDDSFSGRLYQAYLQADDIIKNTSVRLGRFYLDHINTFQVDGGDAAVSVTDAVKVYAFGGRPVSYFYDIDDARVYGGGAELKYAENTIVRAEYAYMDVYDTEDDYTQVKLIQIIPNGTVVFGYKLLNDADTFTADVDYQIAATNTILTFGYESLNKDISSDKTYAVNPITYALADQSRYAKYKASAYQAFLKYFAAGVNVETKAVDGEENFDNRDYLRYGMKFDINGLPTEGTYVSFTADKWEIDSTQYTQDNNRFMFGIQVGQEISKSVNVWAGSEFSRYEYDALTDTRKDSVRSYYIGCEYQPTELVGLILDLSREETDFYDDMDSDLSDSYTVELWANIAF